MLICFLATLILMCGAPQEGFADQFALLQEKLVADGFDKTYISGVFGHPKVGLETTSVALFAVHRESKLNYDQYLKASVIHKARRYVKANEATLARAEKEYGVGPEIIAAILLVETRLGAFTGSNNVFNTLATMAALDDNQLRDTIWKQVVVGGDKTRKEFDTWADRRSRWAYTELKAFLVYTRENDFDPLTIAGSYAGAVGLPQFMPSNIKRLARDGNGDGRIDLLDHEDAIYSIANFLKHYGWKPGIDRKKKYKVLLRYNYSKYYVNTLLEIEKRL